MGIPVLIYGKSGSGKSRSLKGFGADEIVLVNVLGKPLPFKNSFKYITKCDDPATIMAGIAKLPEGVKTVVVDDFGYVMTNMFMRGHADVGTGNAMFNFYNNIADVIWNFISYISGPAVAHDVIVYLIMHEETAEDGTNKLKTIGKLLDQKVCIEGMVTVVLHSIIKGDQYVFLTQGNGLDIAKAPEEMFAEREIPNDLKAVDEAIRAYWGMKEKKGGK